MIIIISNFPSVGQLRKETSVGLTTLQQTSQIAEVGDTGPKGANIPTRASKPWVASHSVDG